MPRSARPLITRLKNLRGLFTPKATSEKISLLDTLTHQELRNTSDIRAFHSELCYMRAFPDSPSVYREAQRALRAFFKHIHGLRKKIKETLADDGIIGTTIEEVLEYGEALRLCAYAPQRAGIHWADYEDPEKLDELLCHTLSRMEEPAFEAGNISTEDWLHTAMGRKKVTDLAWTIRQIQERIHSPRLRAQLYDSAEIPVPWELKEDSVTLTQLKTSSPSYRQKGMRRFSGNPLREILKPQRALHLLPPSKARAIIHVAATALLSRRREVFAITHANPKEVYLADFGEGAQLAVIGTLPAFRLGLEAHYGFVLLSNGVPIGYGGVSPLFSQVNTGINIFPEYRKSEAAYLFLQCLRTFHTLFNCRHIFADRYQIGGGNKEGRDSGAFWLYYKLGFRPLDSRAREIAAQEYIKLKKNRSRKTPPKTLLALSSCDMKLTLPVKKRGAFFPEALLETCALGVTKSLGEIKSASSLRGLHIHARNIRNALAIRGYAQWSPSQKEGLLQTAPLLTLIPDLSQWSSAQKKALVRILQSKGKPQERSYALELRAHLRLQEALMRYCKKYAQQLN
jgi:hypothetical protein